MAWDADGCQVGCYRQSQLSQPTHGITPPHAYAEMPILDRQDLNCENPYRQYSGGAYVGTWIFVLFPEKRDIDGIHWNHYGYASVDKQWSYVSNDTTNGEDGTWTNLNYDGRWRDFMAGSFRNNINPFSLTDQLGFRCYSYPGSSDGFVLSLHLYGTISTGETPDRLLFLDTAASDAEFVKPIDQGDIHRGQTIIRTFKLKNNSSTKSINTVQVTGDDLYAAAGDWYTFSLDGVSYQGTLNTIGNIAAGGTQLIYAKMEVVDTDIPFPAVARIKANHATVT